MRPCFLIGSGLLCALGSVLVFSGCVADVPDGDVAEEQDGEAVGVAEEALSDAWTPYTSEEFSPAYCDSGNLMGAVQCQGSYCDNIRLFCAAATNAGYLGSYWTDFFSEEGPYPNNMRQCSPGWWMTGIKCRGSYCDDISLKCSYTGGNQGSCHWTGYMSEEYGGYLGFTPGYYAAAVVCQGSRCDNKSYLICQKL